MREREIEKKRGETVEGAACVWYFSIFFFSGEKNKRLELQKNY